MLSFVPTWWGLFRTVDQARILPTIRANMENCIFRIHNNVMGEQWVLDMCYLCVEACIHANFASLPCVTCAKESKVLGVSS